MPGFTLNDLPLEERPRERLKKYGSEALSVVELLALVLGRGIRSESVMVSAQRLFSGFGSLKGLAEASVEDFESLRGLGLAKAAQLKACFELSKRLRHEEAAGLSKNKKLASRPEDICQLIRSKIIRFNQEHFVVVSLDSRNGVLGIDPVTIGTLNVSLVHPRETFEVAIARHAAQIIIAHNHPSGDVEPSMGDIEATKRIIEAGEILGIKVIDHLIVSKDSYFSFKEKGAF
jgi:DNA repair protein RadC